MNVRALDVRTTRWAVAILLAAGTAAATAQSRDQTQVPRFHSTTDIVTTDVIVRDRRGVFVPGLTMREFEVFEDGVRQTVTTFVEIVGGRAMTEIAPDPAKREGLILPPVKRSEPGRVFAIFIDDLHLQPADSILARRVLGQIRDTLLHEGDLIALVSTGPSGIQGPLTYDYNRTRFNEAIGRVMGNGLTFAEIVAANQTREGPAGLRHNAHVAFRTAYDLIAQLAAIPNRRKAFLYVSSGYDFNPFTNSRFKAVQDMYVSDDQTNSGGLSREDIARFRNPFESGGQQFSEMQLIAELAELARAARRANVAFYTIDPRGLTAGPPIDTSAGIEEWHAHMRTSKSALQLLADETGGQCLCDTNEFKSGLQQIDNATSDYYLIGYVSSNPDARRVLRRIEVRVTRPGVTATGFKREYAVKR